MAGLRFTRTAGQTSTPLETRSGSYIYNGDPAYFHDWEFRTLMRLKLYEDAIKAKAQKKASRRNSRRSPTPQDEPTDADAEVDAPGELPNGGDLASLAAAMSRESPSDTSPASKHGKSSKPSVTSRASHGPKDLPEGDDLDELSASATQARTEMVQKVLEGLREEAFELARDIGVDVLTQPGGLRKFVKKLRDVVFPRASEEARELFKAGQKPGSLARQNGESMLSYVSRRRRWWKLLKTLDGSIELSEPMRVELLLELSGLSRQEIIVIKACAPDAKSFESVAATPVEQYSGVHLREGRSLGQPNLRNSGNLQSKSSRPSGYRPKGKGKTYRAYTADAWYEEDPTYEEDQEQEEDFHEASYQVFDEDTAPGYPEDPEGDGEDYEDYELSESEAIALNCLEELEESSEAGHAVQLQLAAHAAFGKAKGKGKGKSKKGKGKGKGKVVRSHLTLEQRRDKLKSLKAKSKCMRCGALGHWAGDPECKFPSQGGGKGKAHLAVIADEGLSIPAGNDTAAAFVARAKSSAASSAAAAKPIAAPAREPRAMVMEGGDKKFYLGQHRNETYAEVAKKIEFIQWLMAQSDLSMQNKDFLTWFNRYYTIQDGSVQARASRGHLREPTYLGHERRGLGRPHLIHLYHRSALCVRTSPTREVP